MRRTIGAFLLGVLAAGLVLGVMLPAGIPAPFALAIGIVAGVGVLVWSVGLKVYPR